MYVCRPAEISVKAAMGGGKGSRNLGAGQLAADHPFENRTRVGADLGSSAQLRSESSSSSPDRERDESIGKSPDRAVEVAIGRLEQLRIHGEGAQISMEQMSSNDQRQEDEMLALEAIYGDDVVTLDRKEGLRLFQITVNYEVPDDHIVSAKLYSSAMILKQKDEIRDNNTEGFLYTFKVQHLPPIVLTCLLPLSYPSHRSPFFTVFAEWLDASNISRICDVLDSIWVDQTGQEVMYQWIEWLKSSSLSHLGFNDEIKLGSYDRSENSDVRAISGGISLERVIASMIWYNDEKSRDVFFNSLQLCSICFNEYAGANFVKLACQHFFCFNCMETYCSMHVKEGTVTKLLCPETKCGGVFPPALLRRLLGSEKYERWESLMLQKTLESMADVVYCPRCETACLEDEENHAQCSKCFFSFCSLCRDRRHLGFKCMTPETKLLILKGRQSSSNIKDEQRKKELEMINNILSTKEALRDAMQCPSCKMGISRTGGCNKMACQNCGQYFCYSCGAAIDGYEHFKKGCQLFPREEILEWEAFMNPRQVIGQIQAGIHLDIAQTCPNCGQMNAKVGNNNHIFCWACQKHYCALCRQTVRRTSEHFGPKGCKQHTSNP